MVVGCSFSLVGVGFGCWLSLVLVVDCCWLLLTVVAVAVAVGLTQLGAILGPT